jgi:hypothetical protein
MQIVCQTHGVGEGEVICSKCVELAEQKINSLQQLKAKIHAMCIELECTTHEKFEGAQHAYHENGSLPVQ